MEGEAASGAPPRATREGGECEIPVLGRFPADILPRLDLFARHPAAAGRITSATESPATPRFFSQMVKSPGFERSCFSTLLFQDHALSGRTEGPNPPEAASPRQRQKVHLPRGGYRKQELVLFPAVESQIPGPFGTPQVQDGRIHGEKVFFNPGSHSTGAAEAPQITRKAVARVDDGGSEVMTRKEGGKAVIRGRGEMRPQRPGRCSRVGRGRTLQVSFPASPAPAGF